MSTQNDGVPTEHSRDVYGGSNQSPAEQTTQLSHSPRLPVTPTLLAPEGATQAAGTGPENTNSHPNAQGTGRETNRVPRTIDDHFNPRAEATGKKTLRANIRLASYNIRGGGSSATTRKWDNLNQIMRENQIGILAVQETHLTKSETNRLNGLYEKRCLIINSSLHRRHNAAGVAIILNKQWTAWNEAHHWEIVPGRAILVQIPWKNTRGGKRTILAIYAPNDPTENKSFWDTLRDKFKNPALPKPDFMLGDFNLVEDALDRIPAHEDDPRAVEALRALKRDLSLIDGWRRENGGSIAYSYLQSATGTQSRIDRIYVHNDLFPTTNEWTISHEAALSDHNLVTMRYFDAGSPEIGFGRWSIPIYATEDPEFIKKILPFLENALQMKPNEEGETETNPQKRLKTLKMSIKEEAKNYVAHKVPLAKKKIAALEIKLQSILNLHPEIPEEERKTTAASIEEEIRETQLHHHLSTRDKIHLKYSQESERIGKTWIRANKDLTGRDQIMALRKLEPEANGGLEYNSEKMAEIARKYHDEIQNAGRCYEVAEEERQRKIEQALESLKSSLTQEEAEPIGAKITAAEVRKAMYESATEKSTGLDGIPVEIWKKLTRAPSTIDQDEDPEKIEDAAALLRDAFNDVIDHGVVPKLGFISGWLSPIFKKKDKTHIENYRPITVLNADYKIMTKILAARITMPSLKLIHKDQAGFMKGRRIENQTDLIRCMIEYGRVTDTRGLLVFLDQEKAYDKIQHDFLLKTLERMNFPPRFIQGIKAIYKSATTRVIINGKVSEVFTVRRGVRQGDPLSCLLFNFAIESLACMIRDSALKGFTTPQATERLIISMFADDTTVFLSEDDNFEKLTELLDNWCIASGAKFNVGKTEIVPIGSKEYRDQVVQSRKGQQNHPPIPDNIKIAKEGEPVRALGAFVGNGIEECSVWTPTIETIETALKRWQRSHPTVDGKRLIINMEVGGRTQYRTTVQGMPLSVEKHLNKTIREFYWGGKAAYVSAETLALSLDKGGLKSIDLGARREAIHLMRLKRYMERPRWAPIVDALLALNIPKQNGNILPRSAINCFTQNWNPAKQTNRSSAPLPIREMIKTANKYGTSLWTNHPSESLKREMPIWLHLGSKRRRHASDANDLWAKCQRDKHDIKTTGEMFDHARKESEHTLTPAEGTLPSPNSATPVRCECDDCKKDRAKGCNDPIACRRNAKRMIDSLYKTWIPNPNRDEQSELLQEKEEERIPRNRATSVEEAFRVFTTWLPPSLTTDRDYNTPYQHPRTPPDPPIVIYTDGSGLEIGTELAAAGAGVYLGEDHPSNLAIRIPSTLPQTNNVAEAAAILAALNTVPGDEPLLIKSDSLVTIQALTKYAQKAEDNDWLETKNREILEPLIGAIRNRQATTKFEKVKAHVGILGNERADRLADEGAKKDAVENEDNLNLSIPLETRVQGLRLSTATQATLYRGIRREKEKATPPRKKTAIQLDIARHEIKERTGKSPTDRAIWNSLRGGKIENKRARQLVWKMLHDCLPVGRYWDKMTNYEHRAECSHCGTTESLEHIFTECQYTGQSTIWTQVEEILEKKGIAWTTPTMGMVLGCGISNLLNKKGKYSQALNRAYSLIISEATILIWRIRCEWRIQREEDTSKAHTRQEIQNRWHAQINKVLKFDILATWHRKRKDGSEKGPTEDLVINTWWDIVDSNTDLEWEVTKKRRRRKTGVLVGMAIPLADRRVPH